MFRSHALRAAFVLLLLLVMTISPPQFGAVRQQATPDPGARLAAPAAGATIFGAVTISGTANTSGFQNYRLDYLAQADPASGWQPIGRQVAQQVTGGVLAQWDTSALKDGVYQIRLRVILRNGTVLEDYIRELRVQNQQPTPLPTFPPTLTPPAAATAGATLPPLIQQPPSATPRAVTATAVPSLPPPTTVPLALSTAAQDSGSGGSFGGAVCTGAILALIGFALYGGYGALRSRRRTA